MAGLLKSIGDWFQKQKEREYLLSSESLELMDAGISQSDFLVAMSAPGDTRERMLSMAASFGLPPEAIDRNRWFALDAARVCGQCKERAVCKSWLDGLDDDQAPETFCPNAARYTELAISIGVDDAASPEKTVVNKGKSPWYL